MNTLLFCFPHAGGNPLQFQDWQRRFPDGVTVKPIQPPGRGLRFGEPPIGDYRRLVQRYADDIAEALQAAGTRRYALFGHSAGARFAFGAALAISRAGGPEPLRLTIAGSSAPHRARLERTRSQLSDEELRQSLRRMGGSPAKVLEDPSLMELMLPLLRADFSANEGAHAEIGSRLECPFTLIAAEGDQEYTPERVFEWAGYTWGKVRQVCITGDHFSMVRAPDSVLREIGADLVVDAVATHHDA